MVVKPCALCGEPFKVKSGGQKYCCEEHRDIAAQMKTERRSRDWYLRNYHAKVRRLTVRAKSNEPQTVEPQTVPLESQCERCTREGIGVYDGETLCAYHMAIAKRRNRDE